MFIFQQKFLVIHIIIRPWLSYFLGRRIVEAESEFAKLDLAEDDVIKSVYEGSKSNRYIENKSIIRSDGGNIQDDSVANPNLNIPRPQVNI